MLLRISADWNEPRESVSASTLAAHWHFPHGLPVSTAAWRKQAARYARKLLELSQAAGQRTVLHDPFAMHVARMCLMLADHHYSSLTDPVARALYLSKGYPLYANTRSNHYQNNSCSRLIDTPEPTFQSNGRAPAGCASPCHAGGTLPAQPHAQPAGAQEPQAQKRSADPRLLRKTKLRIWPPACAPARSKARSSSTWPPIRAK